MRQMHYAKGLELQPDVRVGALPVGPKRKRGGAPLEGGQQQAAKLPHCCNKLAFYILQI